MHEIVSPQLVARTWQASGHFAIQFISNIHIHFIKKHLGCYQFPIYVYGNTFETIHGILFKETSMW